MRTLEELKEVLASRLDEVDLIDLLHINTYQIVEAFEDLISEDFTRLEKEMEDE